jgi:hypothetical protein
LISPDLNNFAPRVGLAYQITNKLVLRTGYGIFYGGPGKWALLKSESGFQSAVLRHPKFQPAMLPFGKSNPSGQVDCSIQGLSRKRLSQGFPSQFPHRSQYADSCFQ